MADPPESPGTSPMVLYYDGVEVGAVEWNASGEEVVGNTSRFTVTVQDRANSDWEPQPHHDVKITIRSSGWVLARGESLTPTCSLPVGFEFRRWTIPCRSYDALVREALFGAPDGGNFWRPNAREQYRPVDPDARTYATDDGTIQTWIAHYRPDVGGVTIDTATHVHQYASNLGDPGLEQIMYDAMTTLGGAIDVLAGLLPVNVQDWLDPDLKWHHVAIPTAVDLLADGDEGDLDTAPAAIGPGELGLGAGADTSFDFTWDGQDQPEQVYLQGDTTFTHNDTDVDAAGASGFYPVDGGFPNLPVAQDAALRQAYLPGTGIWTREGGILRADQALRRAAQPTLRATFPVQGVDGWRAGQAVIINDARFPPSLQGEHKFVIQRIAWSLYAGTDDRRYQIDVGDGPVSRANSGARRPVPPDDIGPKAKQPAISWRMEPQDDEGHPDYSPISANETRNYVAYTANAKGELRVPVGTEVSFGVVARDGDPDSPTYTDIVPAMGSFSPNPTTTDQDGLARTTFTAGTQDRLSYQPFAETELPQV